MREGFVCTRKGVRQKVRVRSKVAGQSGGRTNKVAASGRECKQRVGRCGEIFHPCAKRVCCSSLEVQKIQKHSKVKKFKNVRSQYITSNFLRWEGYPFRGALPVSSLLSSLLTRSVSISGSTHGPLVAWLSICASTHITGRKKGQGEHPCPVGIRGRAARGSAQLPCRSFSNNLQPRFPLSHRRT